MTDGRRYDALGRLAGETITGPGEPVGGRRVSYGYDAAGDVASIAWPDTGANALTATYAWDVLRRVTQISVGGAVIAAYAYDQYGRRSSIARNGGAGAATTYGYDGADRISSLAQALSGASAITWTLGYDPSGAVTSRQASNTGYLWHSGAASTAYAANGLDQYTTVGGAAMGYDGRANLASNGAKGQTLTYDANNALLTASAPTAASLAYDPAGRLLSKTAGGSTATFLYAGSRLIGEYDAAGNILARYVPGPGTDEAALMYQGAGTASAQWLHGDQQGSTIAWSNGAGAALGTQAYDPYGRPQTWNGPRYAYTGQLMLPEAQLYHYKARAYDPALGRFAQTDPAGYASDINPYAYVGNDPVNGTDPSGMVDCNAGTDTTIGCTITLGPPEIDRAPRFDSLGLGVFGGVGGERGDKSGGGKGGHDYRVRDEVCRRQLTNAEGADLLSRYAVPNTYEMGYSLSNGEYFVTNQAGMFGGFVQTTFSAGGLVATNVTTPVHVFVGTIVRSIAISGGASYINTHGFGNSGPDIGVLRDDLNMDLGPGLFKFFDENAAAYAKSHYPGC